MIATGVPLLLRKAIAAGGSDPYWSSVTLLVPGTGANNGTVWSDLSLSARTITRNGNALTSTAQSKFDGSSTLLNAAGDNLTVTSSVSLATGDFCLEAFLYIPTVANSKQVLCRRAGANGYLSQVDIPNNGTVACFWQQWTAGTVYQLTPVVYKAITPNSWIHFCWERIGNVLSTYIDGVYCSGLTTANRPGDPGAACKIGQDSGGADYNFNGHWSHIRLTQRTGGRYGAAFTPPSVAYPTS